MRKVRLYSGKPMYPWTEAGKGKYWKRKTLKRELQVKCERRNAFNVEKVFQKQEEMEKV